jgi:hypothetical protein
VRSLEPANGSTSTGTMTARAQKTWSAGLRCFCYHLFAAPTYPTTCTLAVKSGPNSSWRRANQRSGADR